MISNRVQTAYSADKCSDTADETVRLLHLKDRSDLEWLAKESLQRQASQRQDDGGYYYDYSASSLPVWVTEADALWLLCPGVRYITPSPSPLPRPGFRECQRAPKLCRRTMGPPFWMWHIPVGAVFKHPLILCLWVGLVGVTLTTQPTPSWPQATAAAASLHFHRSHFHICIAARSSTAKREKHFFPLG